MRPDPDVTPPATPPGPPPTPAQVPVPGLPPVAGPPSVAGPPPVPGPPSVPGLAPGVDRAALERKVSFYQRMTVFLGAVAVFLGVVLIAQSALDAPADTPGAVVTVTETPAPGPDVTPGPAPSAEPVPYADSAVVRREAGDPMAVGAVDAPVVLSKWTDFRCPYCAAFGRTTLPQIIDEYVDAGLVRIEVHDVAFFGEQSQAAAVAARAAGAQGRYFEYLHAVSAAAPEGGHADLPREALLAFAEEIGVPDLDRFAADLDDPELWTAVQDSTATAQYLGVSGVPFFVVGEAALSGAYPMDVFRQILDEALALAG